MDTDLSTSVKINPYATPRTDIEKRGRDYSNHAKASRFKRLLAIAIDIAILVGVELLILLIIGSIVEADLLGELTRESEAFWFDSGLLEPMAYVGLIVEMSIFFSINGYFLYTRGQTLGKMALNIVIVDSRTYSLPTMPTLIAFRYLPFWISLLIMVLVLVVFVIVDGCFLFGSDRRALHDRFARTVVVDLGKSIADGDVVSGGE